MEMGYGFQRINNVLLSQIQNLTEDNPTRWRDLLFDIKKGANWSFPLSVEGIKSDFVRFLCETFVLYIPSRRNSHLR